MADRARKLKFRREGSDDKGVMSLHRPNLPLQFLGSIVLGIVAGCSGERAAPTPEAEAAYRFTAFQDALFERDRKALRGLICRDAHEAVDALCKTELEGRRRLRVTGVTRSSYEYHVHVTDPAAKTSGPGESFYVLTKEDGKMRIDLLATTRYHSVTTHTQLAKPTFVPGPLDPIQREAALREAARRDAAR